MSDLIKYQTEVLSEQGEVDKALNAIRAVTIYDQTSATWAGNMLLHAKARGSELETQRKDITGPILQTKAKIDELFKPLIERYNTAETILKTKIADYNRMVEMQRRAAMQASAAEYQAGGIPTAIIPEPVKVQGITVRPVWDFEIVDESQVPREFCSPDGRKLRAHMPRDGAPRPIPGIRFFQKDRVAARAGK